MFLNNTAIRKAEGFYLWVCYKESVNLWWLWTKALLISTEAPMVLISTTKYLFSNHSTLKKAGAWKKKRKIIMIQPYYAVEGVASFWTTTESERWVLSRAIIWLLVLWYEHWPRFHIFNFPIPIPHSPFLVLAVSISHTAPLGVALQL